MALRRVLPELDSDDLNLAYTRASTSRRYESWFLRFGLADGSGAWWLRYVLTSPGRPGGGGCPQIDLGQPAQVWATWFPAGGRSVGVIAGYPLEQLDLSQSRAIPFRLGMGPNHLTANSCRGEITGDGHQIRWHLRYRSHYRFTMSHKGWIGFSRTPHSDAVFSGEIELDGKVMRGEVLGTGVQGHNCGYRHRSFWTWSHATFADPAGGNATLETLIYEMPLGLFFRKSVLWLRGRSYTFRSFVERRRDRENMVWDFSARGRHGTQLEALVEGGGPGVHRVPYVKTDCSGRFEVANHSLARARLRFHMPGMEAVELATAEGAVLEMVG